MFTYYLMNHSRVNQDFYVSRLPRHIGTPLEGTLEFAARTCYRSYDRMGTDPGFLRKLRKWGHHDVIEHIHLTLWVCGTKQQDPVDSPLSTHKFLHVIKSAEATLSPSSASIMVAGNLRTWIEVSESHPELNLRPFLDSYLDALSENHGQKHTSIYFIDDMILPQPNVSLISASYGALGNDKCLHGSVYIHDVSRAMTHQIVRHRLASFSQESQRYIDLEDADWGIIYPHTATDEQKAILDRHWGEVKRTYVDLRKSGLLKEDARCVLPNMAETSLVMSGDMDMWKHFFRLRAFDTAAQHEIRSVGKQIFDLFIQIPEIAISLKELEK